MGSDEAGRCATKKVLKVHELRQKHPPATLLQLAGLDRSTYTINSVSPNDPTGILTLSCACTLSLMPMRHATAIAG